MTRPLPDAPPLARHRPFLAFWVSQTFSQLGEQLGGLALPVLAVGVLGATSLQLGVLNALDTAAFLVIGLPAGAWLDRLRKRRVMLLADLARGLLLVTVPLAWAAHLLTIGQLFVVGALLSVGTVFFDVGYQSFVPFLVPRGRIADANGRLEATAQIARVAGPGLAGVLLAVVSAPLLLLAPAVTYLASFVVLTRVRDTEAPTAGVHERLVPAIRAGLGYVVRHPLISRITAATGTSNLFSTVVTTLLPLLVLRELRLGAPVLGLVVAVGALGGIAGAVAAAPLGRRLGEGRLLPVALGTAAVAALLVPLAGTLPATGLAPAAARVCAVVLLVLAEFGTSFGAVAYNVTQVSFRQQVCPPHLLGRMNASIRFLVWGVMPLGALAAGALATALGTVPALWLGALGGLPAVAFVATPRIMAQNRLSAWESSGAERA